MSQVPPRQSMERHEEVRVSRRGGPVESEEVVSSTGPPIAGVSMPTPAVEHREHRVQDVAAERRFTLGKVEQLVWLVVGIIDGLIGVRVLLKLIAANPDSPFVGFIYSASGLFLWPFAGATASPASGGMVLEIPALIALLVYALLGWVVVRGCWVIFDRISARSVSTYDRSRQ
jgi:hypothetical protein